MKKGRQRTESTEVRRGVGPKWIRLFPIIEGRAWDKRFNSNGDPSPKRGGSLHHEERKMEYKKMIRD